MDAQILRAKIQAVPQKVREWFSSEAVATQIGTISQHFGIIDENQRRIIPRLLLRLEIQDIEPDYFSGELSQELKIDRDRAMTITAEIKRIILSPIKKELSDSGVDMSLLDQFQVPIVKKPQELPKLVSEIKPPISATPTTPPPTKEYSGEFERLGKISPAPFFTKPTMPETKPPETNEAEPLPMIIHEEKTTAKPLQVAPGFKIGTTPPAKVSSETATGKIAAPPVPAVLEFGTPPKTVSGAVSPSIPPKVGDENPRVVHYTDLKTPLQKTASERIEITAGPSPAKPSIPTTPTPPKPPVVSEVEPLDSAPAVVPQGGIMAGRRGISFDQTGNGKPPFAVGGIKPPPLPQRPPSPPRPPAANRIEPSSPRPFGAAPTVFPRSETMAGGQNKPLVTNNAKPPIANKVARSVVPPIASRIVPPNQPAVNRVSNEQNRTAQQNSGPVKPPFSTVPANKPAIPGAGIFMPNEPMGELEKMRMLEREKKSKQASPPSISG